jgi:hypothetical protein
LVSGVSRFNARIPVLKAIRSEVSIAARNCRERKDHPRQQ